MPKVWVCCCGLGIVGLYSAGGFMFPTTTGSYSVTGLGFRPQSVLMFGTNSSTMDSLVAYPGGTVYPGLFISLSGLDYLDGTTIRTLCVSIGGASSLGSIAGAWVGQYPVRMSTQTGFSNLEYRADSITFDHDGFTVNVTDAASSDRWIHWFAVGQHNLGSVMAQPLTGPWSNTYVPTSALVLGTTAQSAYTDQVYTGEAWLSFGAGSFPVTNSLDWTKALGYSGVLLASAVGRQGLTGDFADFNGQSMHASGPILLEDIVSYEPTGAGSTTMSGGTTFLNYVNAVWWDGNSECDFVSIPAAAATNHIGPPPTFEDTQAVVFLGSNNTNANVSTEHNISYTIGVLTEDYQGCVAFSKAGEIFQSSSVCAATCESGTLATAAGDLSSSSGYDLIGVAGSGSNIQQIQFGGDFPILWVPQIYRRW